MTERPAIVMTEREHLVRAIKDGLRRIDEHDRKIEEHQEKIEEQENKRDEREVEVGTALKALKAQKPKSIKWEQHLEECGIEIHRSRADQLIRIADGRTTVEEERAATAERVAKSRNELPIRIGEDDPEASAEAMKAKFAEMDDAASIEEKGRTPPGTTSWRVQVIDDSGKTWSCGVRFAGKAEAMAGMGSALDTFKGHRPPIVEMRTIESGDKPNVVVPLYKSGPRKGGATLTTVFEHGTCHLFGWHEEGAEQQHTPAELPGSDDLDIPNCLRREPRAAAS
jgi:hypothetical protein